MTRRHLILLEFNELCPVLLEKWIAEGQLPHFQRFYEQAEVFTARADDDEALEPWIQWYSVHTGLAYSQHRVFNLTDGPLAPYPDVWRILLNEGLRVASCASMNVKAFTGRGCLYIPDPWCTSESPLPPQYAAYQTLVSNLVQENSTGGKGGLRAQDYARFCLFCMTHGLRPSTVWAGVEQLWSETMCSANSRWKRAMILDRLQFDLFRHYWLKHRPDFATFFLNSTAHYQHAYWHCLFPEQFPVAPNPRQIHQYQGAILSGYQAMDRLLGECRRFEQEGATLVLATALSQHRSGHSEMIFYRARDVQSFLRMLGLSPVSVMPVMAEQYSAVFPDPESTDYAKRRLRRLQCHGQQLMYLGDSPEGKVFFGCRLREPVAMDTTVDTGEGRPAIRFHDCFYALPHTKSGIHHPDSVLWFKTGRHEVHHGKVSILDILPSLLTLLGVDSDACDREHHRFGRTLLWDPRVPDPLAPARNGAACRARS